jgi:predicted XRE-type DNA-binding protein
MPLRPYSELVKISVPAEKRDGADYLPWAVCKQLLHDNGAEKVYFIPCVNEKGSSLFMSDVEFKDSKENTNRCYEVRVKIVIDDLEFEYQTPVMNGSNPVKDNSMSQQRVWNAQTRAFVKGVAVHTGLGFNLWLKDEDTVIKEDDLTKHNIFSIKERVELLITSKMKKRDIDQRELCNLLDINDKQFQAIMKSFDSIFTLEKLLSNL